MHLGTSERNRLRGLSAVNDPASSSGITRGESLIKLRPINHFISKAAIRCCGAARIRGLLYGKPHPSKSWSHFIDRKNGLTSSISISARQERDRENSSCLLLFPSRGIIEFRNQILSGKCSKTDEWSIEDNHLELNEGYTCCFLQCDKNAANPLRTDAKSRSKIYSRHWRHFKCRKEFFADLRLPN